jgi:hypothetical protein
MLRSAPRWARSRFFTAFRREQSKMAMWGFQERQRQALSAPAWERGRRRTRQDQISLKACEPGEIADLKIRTERRKSVSSAGPFFGKERTLQKIRSSRLT